MRSCSCDEEYNLVMLMCNEEFTVYWVECDFCGNKTQKYNNEETALFKWNEFQFNKGKPTEEQE